MPELDSEAIDVWKTRWREASSDSEWIAEKKEVDERRAGIIVEMGDLTSRFLDGEIDIEELRETFDHKTRGEWDLFGLKGLSGAMFLNKLVKHLDELDGVTQSLRDVLPAPSSPAAARAAIDKLLDFLDAKIRAGFVTKLQIQPSRTVFFLSAFWHVQDRSKWPIAYGSAIRAFVQDDLLERNKDRVAEYLEFREVFLGLAAALEIDVWQLEHLCTRLDGADSGEDGPTVVVDDAESVDLKKVWLISAGHGGSKWAEWQRDGVMAIGIDELTDLSEYSDLESVNQAIRAVRKDGKNPVNDALAGYQFAHEMNEGDDVFVKKGRYQIIGYGRIRSGYRYDPAQPEYHNVRDVDWIRAGEWKPRDKPLITKTLTEIGRYPKLVNAIRNAIGIDREGVDEDPTPVEDYTIDRAEKDIFAPRSWIEETVDLLRYKRNIVLQGPPGVGKTYVASRLAYLLIGSRSPEQLERVQFHQSYSYEDFVQGFRPAGDGSFERRDGPFLRFCDKALQDSGNAYVLIIDEINRGNLSKILGELMLLIEGDKRSQEWATTLTYAVDGEETFYVPSNLYVIGTMNTADRSLALVDYALRRRFAFIDVPPAFESRTFAALLHANGVDRELEAAIRRRLKVLNALISNDSKLGDGFLIGHSYFCQKVEDGACDEAWYARIVENEIKPLLREYWFDDAESAEEAVAVLLADD